MNVYKYLYNNAKCIVISSVLEESMHYTYIYTFIACIYRNSLLSGASDDTKLLREIKIPRAKVKGVPEIRGDLRYIYYIYHLFKTYLRLF